MDEIAFALMVHFANDDERYQDRDGFKRLLVGLKNNLPQLIPTLQLSANEKRRAIRELGLPRPPGVPLADIPMIEIPEEYHDHILRYLRKLARAIYYRHVGKPLPPDMTSWAMWSYGKVGNNREAVEAWSRLTPHFVEGKRTNVDLGDRFRYRVNYSDEMLPSPALGNSAMA